MLLSSEMESRSPVYENLKGTLISFPAAAAFTLLCKLLRLPDMILWYFFSIPVHEFGHAFAGWFGGRFALPIGAFIPMAGFTYISFERSILVYITTLGVLGYGVYRSARDKTPFLFLTGILCILIQFHLTWRTSQTQWQHAVTYSGIGGEFILGTFLTLAYYFRMPDRFRWDFFRPASLVVGTYAFLSAFLKWREIRSGVSEMPLGSFLSGSGDANGDLDRLILEYSWTVNDVIAHFNRLGTVCLTIILGTYLYCSFRAWKKSRE